MADYRVVLKNSYGDEIVAEIVPGLAAAKARAKYFLSPEYARQGKTTHEAMDTQKVEVLNARGECLWDLVL